ncbi:MULTISPECIES: hypothetical protein [Vibrio]|uniref:hypothetical protein n=1 Tax=Vibrio TaxID=662 RepID=UPI002075E93D|nr:MULTISPECIES: hypothetical protein [Vibrio]USD33700.1 hypothetical protein J8Z27_06250 [Vibrio sp. SCSIO 43186]USD46771.1 hypothetical protein J4N38_06450 [Vibrio sp. SCSIO 43145]USD70824.1 hypothetical protein J4N41_06250 [Vibrio sp. SCSIO 43139]USD95738.1 hypothetical protein CTT30_06355 [Vibrio coralliilyticus]
MSLSFCEKCGEKTEHKELIKQKPSKYGKSKKEQFKAFLEGFFGGVASPVGASLDLIDRYVVCEKCGYKTLENLGDAFQ